jgi:hypothetical protein
MNGTPFTGVIAKLDEESVDGRILKVDRDGDWHQPLPILVTCERGPAGVITQLWLEGNAMHARGRIMDESLAARLLEGHAITCGVNLHYASPSLVTDSADRSIVSITGVISSLFIHDWDFTVGGHNVAPATSAWPGVSIRLEAGS